MTASDRTPEQTIIDAELRQRIGTKSRTLTIDALMNAAASEGHVVDVRAQPFTSDDPVLYTVRFHPTLRHPFSVSHDDTDLNTAFVKCFRQADDLAAQQLADQQAQRERMNPS